MEHLEAEAVFDLLRHAPVGRLAVIDRSTLQVHVTPLFFAYGGGRIFFITQPGRKLTLLTSWSDGVTLQTDVRDAYHWQTALVSGRFVALRKPTDIGEALVMLANKYRIGFAKQVIDQARAALTGGIDGMRRAVLGSTIGSVEIERASGRRFAVEGLDERFSRR